MITSPFHAFVGSTKPGPIKPVPLYKSSTGSATVCHLLWGDGIRFKDDASANTRRQVIARGRPGWIDAAAPLDGQSLLEFYFIDVGQGDGILVKTPDFRHVMIDGGNPRTKQPTGKSAADFVDWKFSQDYGLNAISLDALIASHSDEDHYGGLADLLDPAQSRGLCARQRTVEAAYHAGLSRWKKTPTAGTLGALVPSGGERYFVDLLGDRASAIAAVAEDAKPGLSGRWAAFIKHALRARTLSGEPTPLTRLSHLTHELPGFSGSGVTFRVLAPIEHDVAARPGLRQLGSSGGKNTNGHSVLLRVDYGRSRTLLTGDLNRQSQRLLLESYTGRRSEFAADVAKACHHGSEDVSIEFLKAIEPSVTVISSGDAEGYGHPRPQIVAASGITGHPQIVGDELVTPLVYSTEIARSYRIAQLDRITLTEPNVPGNTPDLTKTTLHYTERTGGVPSKRTGSRKARGAHVVSGIVYGLVNVRTDGHHFQTATLNETDNTWTTREFESRF